MTMEEKILSAGAFAQVSLHRDSLGVAPPPPPETFGAYEKKGEKSAGVMGLMDEILKELDSDVKDAEYEEKTAQKDYSELMADSQETRAQDAKSLTDKEASKAAGETKLIQIKIELSQAAEDLDLAGKFLADLHVSCDFIMQNFDLRKEARAAEVDSLKNAKAVLSGASFSL